MASYGIYIGGVGFVRSYHIASSLAASLARRENPEARKHLCEITRLESQGMAYANEDCDVLSKAWHALQSLEANEVR